MFQNAFGCGFQVGAASASRRFYPEVNDFVRQKRASARPVWDQQPPVAVPLASSPSLPPSPPPPPPRMLPPGYLFAGKATPAAAYVTLPSPPNPIERMLPMQAPPVPRVSAPRETAVMSRPASVDALHNWWGGLNRKASRVPSAAVLHGLAIT